MRITQISMVVLMCMGCGDGTMESGGMGAEPPMEEQGRDAAMTVTDAAIEDVEVDAHELEPDAAPESVDMGEGGVLADGSMATPMDAAPSPSVDSGPSVAALECARISEANPQWEVCTESPDECAGVFADGAGCAAFCAAAGLVCTGRFGGEPGCQLEPDNPMDCAADNGHASDWCVCGRPDASNPGADPPDAPGDPLCPGDAQNPPMRLQMGYREAAYTQRHNWVLNCYDYAYTAHGAEHEECDPDFEPDGSRRGTATFTFLDVPPGNYRVMIGSRHTENRNGAGAVFLVNGRRSVMDQRVNAPERVWEPHGDHCLSGRVDVVLDSTPNAGSDSVFGVRLEPR